MIFAAMQRDFYPRPPRGGRRSVCRKPLWRLTISIHALREEGDFTPVPSLSLRINFYPRPPRGGRLRVGGRAQSPAGISIHALREEGDIQRPAGSPPFQRFLSTPSARRATRGLFICAARPSNFYPRPPRGGRRRQLHAGGLFLGFLSTPSARRATSSQMVLHTGLLFLSTPSARRATADAADDEEDTLYFYPRPPRGGRPGWERRRKR